MHDKLRHIFGRGARGQNGRQRSNDNDPQKNTPAMGNKNICPLWPSLYSFYTVFITIKNQKNTSISS